MKIADFLPESSGYSLSGSYTTDLITSKLWLAYELKQVLNKQGIDSIPVAYVLGSWYANLSTVLRKTKTPIDLIVNVEKNPQWSKQGHQIQKVMNISGVKDLVADANKITYKLLEKPALVINTSTNDIPDHGWFDHIPTGTLVVLQGRNAVAPGAQHSYESVQDLLELYPLETVIYSGSVELQDPQTAYTRYMAIGIKGSQTLRELTFMGMSQCTKDCSGHRAGYNWSKQRGGVSAASWSSSFNKGAEIASQGY